MTVEKTPQEKMADARYRVNRARQKIGDTNRRLSVARGVLTQVEKQAKDAINDFERAVIDKADLLRM